MFHVLVDRPKRLDGGGKESEGVVQVYVSGNWYSFCDTEFDQRDARVICRELGFW